MGEKSPTRPLTAPCGCELVFFGRQRRALAPRGIESCRCAMHSGNWSRLPGLDKGSFLGRHAAQCAPLAPWGIWSCCRAR